MVQETAGRCPHLRAHYLAEQNVDGADCLLGRLDMGTIGNLIRDPETVTYYLSGPPAMHATLQRGLAERGVEPERIRVDAWA
jgi:Na+-transporting NADH:ubiquinone oxidoreductase subunit NqrF